MEETDIEGLAVEPDVELDLQAAADAQPGLCGGHLARPEPRVGTTLNNVTVSDSSRSPSAQETARGNVSDLVPSMASSTMESVTACSGF